MNHRLPLNAITPGQVDIVDHIYRLKEYSPEEKRNYVCDADCSAVLTEKIKRGQYQCSSRIAMKRVNRPVQY